MASYLIFRNKRDKHAAIYGNITGRVLTDHEKSTSFLLISKCPLYVLNIQGCALRLSTKLHKFQK